MSTDAPASRDTARSPNGRRFVSALPSWRFWLALLIGLTVVFGAFSLASAQKPAGESASQILIDDPGSFFTERELIEAVDDVGWGRPVRVLISTTPASDISWSDTCALGEVACLELSFPSHFRSGVIAEDAVVLWIDTERRTATVRMGTQTGQRPDHFDRVQEDLSTVLTYRAASETLSPSTVADSLQVLADAESETDGLSWGTIIISVLAGGLATILLWTLLNAAWQRYEHRRGRSGLARLSQEQRRKHADEALSTYRLATSTLSEIELIKAAPAGSYQQTLDKRVDQYQRRYIQLARAHFELQHLTHDDLSKLSNLEHLERLCRLSSVVREAGVVLRADERCLRASSVSPEELDSHPSVAHARAALRAATTLAEEMSDMGLARELDVVAEQLDQIRPDTALADLDSVAQRLADVADPAFVSYFSTHGHEFPDRSVIEDPFRFRTLELVGAQGPDPSEGEKRDESDRPELTGESFERELDQRIAQAKERSDTAAIKVPVSSLIVMISAAAAFIVGALVLLLNPLDDDGTGTSGSESVTIPETIADGDLRESALPVPEGNDDTFDPESVEVIDEADLFDDPEALKEALKTIPLPTQSNYAVLTTDTPLTEVNGRFEEGEREEIFPEYYETVASRYADGDPVDTIIIWFADSGDQAGFSHEYAGYGDLNVRGEIRAEDVLESDYPSFEVKTWDALASYSSGVRGVGVDGSTSTVETGTANVAQAVIAAVVSFAVLLVLLPFLIRPMAMRRREEGQQKGLSSTMTALTLTHEALTLDVTIAASEHPGYDPQARLRHWDRDYTEGLRLTSDDARSLKDRLSLARTLRVQAEPLWRIRPILERSPGWLSAWEGDFSALYAVLVGTGSRDARRISALASRLTSGTLDPVGALLELDEIAGARPDTARLRSLNATDPTASRHLRKDASRYSGDELARMQLLDDSKVLAQTSVFSLAASRDIDSEERARGTSLGTVREIEHEPDPGPDFFSLDTSAWELLKRFTGTAVHVFVKPLRGIFSRDRHHIEAVLVSYFIIFVVIASGIVFLATMFDEDRDLFEVEVEGSETPLSVTAINGGGADLSAELLSRLEEAALGIPAHLVLYTTAEQCEPGFVDDLGTHTETVLWALVERYGSIQAAPASVIVCLGDGSISSRQGSGLRIDTNLGRLMEGYGSEDGSHEDWLMGWLDDPDRRALVDLRLTINQQYDDRIR